MNDKILNSLEWLCAMNFHVSDEDNVSIIEHEEFSEIYLVSWGSSFWKRAHFSVSDLHAILYAIDTFFGDHSHSYFEWKHCFDSIVK